MKTPQDAFKLSSIMLAGLNSLTSLAFVLGTLLSVDAIAQSFPSARESIKAFQCASDLHDLATEGLIGDPHGLSRPTPRENFFRWDPDAARAYFPFQNLNRTIEILVFDRQGTAIAVVPVAAARDLLARRTRFVHVSVPWQCEDPAHRSVCLDFNSLSSQRQISIARKSDCEGALEIPAFVVDGGIHLRGSPRLAFVQLPIDRELVRLTGRQGLLERPPELRSDYNDRVRRFRQRLNECASANSGINDASLADVYASAAREFWQAEIGQASP